MRRIDTSFTVIVSSCTTHTLASRNIELIASTFSTVCDRSTISTMRKVCTVLTFFGSIVEVMSRITCITCILISTSLTIGQAFITRIHTSCDILMHKVSVHASITLFCFGTTQTICHITRSTDISGAV